MTRIFLLVRLSRAESSRELVSKSEKRKRKRKAKRLYEEGGDWGTRSSLDITRLLQRTKRKLPTDGRAAPSKSRRNGRINRKKKHRETDRRTDRRRDPQIDKIASDEKGKLRFEKKILFLSIFLFIFFLYYFFCNHSFLIIFFFLTPFLSSFTNLSSYLFSFQSFSLYPASMAKRRFSYESQSRSHRLCGCLFRRSAPPRHLCLRQRSCPSICRSFRQSFCPFVCTSVGQSQGRFRF